MGAPHPEATEGRWHRHGPGGWRRRLKANPATAALYRTVVGVVGTLVVLLGVVLIPLPGPGWRIVFIGLSILGSEFHWARRLNRFARRKVLAWTMWVSRQPRVWQLTVGAAGLGMVIVLALALAYWRGYL
jgi:uncharacterized protein (TIGR02611 family)